jgi:hypothetical protein
MRIFPKSPLPFVSGHLSYLRKIAGDTWPPSPHAGEVGGVITADACDAPFGPGCVKFHALNIVNDAIRSGHYSMLDGALSIFDGRFAQSDKALQPLRNLLVGVRLCIGIAALLAQISRKSAIEIDHPLPFQRADAAL